MGICYVYPSLFCFLARVVLGGYPVSSLLICYLGKGLDNHCKFSRDGTKARITQLRCWNALSCFMSVFLSFWLPFLLSLSNWVGDMAGGIYRLFLAFIAPQRLFFCLDCTLLRFTSFLFARLPIFAFVFNVLWICSVGCNFCSITFFLFSSLLLASPGLPCEEEEGDTIIIAAFFHTNLLFYTFLSIFTLPLAV